MINMFIRFGCMNEVIHTHILTKHIHIHGQNVTDLNHMFLPSLSSIDKRSTFLKEACIKFKLSTRNRHCTCNICDIFLWNKVCGSSEIAVAGKRSMSRPSPDMVLA